MTNSTNRTELADISKVQVDKNLPKHERIAEYIRQMNGDPNRYICNGYTITAKFPGDGPAFEDCLWQLMT
ncbi:hypothetical protein FACS189499_06200 [Clostridia bacterium]|nr:hypothetical protein FACS189499_06200 [Clostridia bacterium]